MQARLDAYRAAPDDINAVLALESHVKASSLEKSLVELVKIRASQINGCAYCLEMHTREARAAGEAEERIHLLPAWRESSFFSERERAALGWTEALTLVAETHAPDSDYAEVEKCFSPGETVSLTLLIGTINLWNRIAVGFRTQHPHRKFPA
jgi:AhpD family alkylhydroperoxidase